MEETKKLEPGKTVIGHIEGKYEGIYRNFTIYYGNVASPVINGNVLHLSEDEYTNMLTTFLETEEGSVYETPTKGEVKASVKELINKETEIKLAEEERIRLEQEELQKEEMEKQFAKEQEERALKLKEIDTQKEANELRKIQITNLKKSIKIQKILNIVFFVICISMIALNIYLLTMKGLI